MRFTFDIFFGARTRNDRNSNRELTFNEREKRFFIGNQTIFCDSFSQKVQKILRDTVLQPFDTHDFLNLIQEFGNFGNIDFGDLLRNGSEVVDGANKSPHIEELQQAALLAAHLRERKNPR